MILYRRVFYKRFWRSRTLPTAGKPLSERF